MMIANDIGLSSCHPRTGLWGCSRHKFTETAQIKMGKACPCPIKFFPIFNCLVLVSLCPHISWLTRVDILIWAYYNKVGITYRGSLSVRGIQSTRTTLDMLLLTNDLSIWWNLRFNCVRHLVCCCCVPHQEALCSDNVPTCLGFSVLVLHNRGCLFLCFMAIYSLSFCLSQRLPLFLCCPFQFYCNFLHFSFHKKNLHLNYPLSHLCEHYYFIWLCLFLHWLC